MRAELRRTLQSLPSRFVGGYLFPSFTEAEAEAQHPYTDLKNSFSEALKATKISNIHFHDLRSRKIGLREFPRWPISLLPLIRGSHRLTWCGRYGSK
jgi:hypothetical protein